MTKTLRIEVTEEMREAGLRAYSPDISEGDYIEAAIAAALSDPTFLAQIRRQVNECIDVTDSYTRASLGRLLGEE